ncbi:hypothetical protein RN001_006673 [Aquatica leii]|uniref:Uncharacterized protein n=1 Tax=Aquatica leii TaxID=1421715 RepID=A0AAN7Q202_9COLE|nr:hypothetical protein RN001_006673 [Aquatica leii]
MQNNKIGCWPPVQDVKKLVMNCKSPEESWQIFGVRVLGHGKVYGVYHARTLHMVALALEENIYTYPAGTSVVILPPENACGNITDEDSEEEDEVGVNNLPGSQLRAEAEVILPDDSSDFDSNYDNIPLSLFLPQRKVKPKKQKIFSWKKEDIPNNMNEPEWTDVQGPKTNFSPTEIFLSFFDDKVFTMIVEETNRKTCVARVKDSTSTTTVSESSINNDVIKKTPSSECLVPCATRSTMPTSSCQEMNLILMRTPTNSLKPVKRKRITDYMDQLHTNEDDLNKALAKFMFGCNVPFALVENAHFKNFIKKFRPAYEKKNAIKKIIIYNIVG